MNERVKFTAAMRERNESFTELCERFGISRKQGYKWKGRYEAGGVDALRDQSRAPNVSGFSCEAVQSVRDHVCAS